jgi:hypothetical protein
VGIYYRCTADADVNLLDYSIDVFAAELALPIYTTGSRRVPIVLRRVHIRDRQWSRTLRPSSNHIAVKASIVEVGGQGVVFVEELQPSLE